MKITSGYLSVLLYFIFRISGKSPFKYGWFLCFSIMFFMVALTSCSDNLSDSTDIPTLDDNTINILIPKVVAGLNNSGYNEGNGDGNKTYANEAQIQNLWFFAFPQGDTSGSYKKALNIIDSNKKLNYGDDDSYTVYTVSDIKEGDYHIYLLANIEKYVDKGNYNTESQFLENLSEEGVKGLILNFSTEKFLVAGNLPMACLNENIVGSEGINSENGAEPYFTFNKDKKTLKVDLSFLCAKVRYTILFDKTESGFSNAFSSEVDFIGADALNIVAETSLASTAFSSGKEQFSLSSIELNKVCYPSPEDGENISQYFESNQSYPEANLAKKESWEEEDSDKRAWQGTIYLPENKFKEIEKLTYLAFTATGNEVREGDGAYKLYLFKGNGADGNIPLLRGKFYDLVIRMSSPENIDLIATSIIVEDWSLEKLEFAIHGPYNLEIETTQLDLDFNDSPNVTLWYKADTKVYPLSPQYDLSNGQLMDFYTFTRGVDEYGRNTFTIGVNPLIPADELNDIANNETDKQKYQYIELKAGNLVKRISVNISNLGPFLDVTPNEIMIDIRDFISKGIYHDFTDILFRTNLDELKVKLSPDPDDFDFNFGTELNPDYLSADGNTESFPHNTRLQLLQGDVDSEGNPTNLSSANKVTSNNDQINLGAKKGILRIDFSGLESNEQLWRQSHSFILIFEANYNGKPLKKYVKIKIKKYNTDYIIHFKTKNIDWECPHIYVYQPLELPIGLLKHKEDKSQGLSEYAGYPVGYLINGKVMPALEYEFTYGLYFNGWQGFGGSVDPYADGHVINGFRIFNDNDNAFVPYGSNTDYYTVLDSQNNYNSTHFAYQNDEFICPECTKQKRGSLLSPGVGMKYEGEEADGKGWWTYILTGIATPGKTRIMFAPSHDGTASYMRSYAEENEVALFDFRDKEGWLLYEEGKGLQFNERQPAEYLVRLYWPQEMGRGLYIWGPTTPYSLVESRNVVKIDSDYPEFYYTEFDYLDSSISLKYLYSDIDGKGSRCDRGHEGILKLSELEFNNSTDTYVGYLESHSDDDGTSNPFNPGYPELSTSDDDIYENANLYVRTIDYSYADSNFKFNVIEKGSKWETKRINLGQGTEFKIGSENWEISISKPGSEMFNISVNQTYDGLTNDPDNPYLYLTEQFDGFVILEKTGNNKFSIELEPY